MPHKPLGPCGFPGCPNRSDCPVHHRPSARPPAPPRPSAAKRLYDRDWQTASAAFLKQHPYCADGCGQLATVVDHIRAHHGDRALFWDRSNWQAMAKACHDRKTARQDGGFGNRRATHG